jgi:hypothetical protein
VGEGGFKINFFKNKKINKIDLFYM